MQEKKEETEIVEALKIIKKYSPKLHLYVAAKLLEKAGKGTHQIKEVEARRQLGTIFHISRESQLRIIKELENYRLLIKVDKGLYLIPLTEQEYEILFNKPLKKIS